MEAYFAFCERLWRQWLDGEIRVTPYIAKVLKLDAVPEPYLHFGPAHDPLIVLTTNPGDVMEHQRRESIDRSHDLLKRSMDYATAERALADFYERKLKGKARTRIEAVKNIADVCGNKGVLQIELIPFHSSQLPDKARVLREIGSDEVCSEYLRHVRAAIRERSVLCISAVTTRMALSKEIELSPWLSWQTSIMNLDRSTAEFLPLVYKGGRVTCAALISKRPGCVKALVLMQGSNQLPDAVGRRMLADSIRA